MAPGCKRAERGAVQRLLGQIGVEVGGVQVERRQADAGDAERVAFAQLRGDARRLHGDAANAAAALQADQGSSLLDDAGKHVVILSVIAKSVFARPRLVNPHSSGTARRTLLKSLIS